MVSKTSPFADQSTWARALGVVVAPAVLGVISGLLLGVSGPAYWVAQVVAIVGGVFGGKEHAGWRPALLRGLISGAIFGAVILAVRALTGWSDKAEIGNTPGFLVVITAIAGALLAAVGGTWGARRGRRS